MGNARSKRRGKLGRFKNDDSSSAGGSRDARRSAEAGRDRRPFSADIHDRWAEDEELQILRRTIECRPEIFILNNLLMSVQFFENYDEEIGNIRDKLVSSREEQLDSRLPTQKHILIPDVLQQYVARKVVFTHMQPSLKHTIELLQPIRIYVVFDNIEVTEENYVSPYCSVNETITYSMQLKPSSHRGYVKLQRLDVKPSKTTRSADSRCSRSVVDESREAIYSDGDSIYGSKFDTRGSSESPRHANDDTSIYNDRDYGSQGNQYDISRSSHAIESPENNGGEQHIHPRNHRGSNEGERTTHPDPVSRTSNGPSIETRPGATKKSPGRHPRNAKESPFHVNASPAGSTSSGYKSENYTIDSDSDYSYARTMYDPPKSSASSSTDVPPTISSSEIPRQCFKKITYDGDGRIYDVRREKRQRLQGMNRMILQALRSRNYDVWFLNSARFMKHFCQLFKYHLAEPMGFDPNIEDQIEGPVVYRDKVEVLEGTTNTRVEQFEILPCIYSQWPECAQEWLDRPRATWPRYSVIEKVKTLGCHMIPEGFGPPTDATSSTNRELEWQLVFPAAERYLETCLSYSQVRVYLVALMLHKTFIRPVDTIFGLTVSHIKNRLFWLVEEDDRPSKWMDNKIGECLLKLLKLLYRSISQDEPNLPDYFIRGKNLFQEKSYLLRTQKQLKRIIDNPVMYVFHAMENIRHSRTFFPRLDYEELLKILTADTLTLVNPALARVSRPLQSKSNSNHSRDYEPIRDFWDTAARKNDKQQKVYGGKPVTNGNLINPRKAFDQVVEIPIRCARMEPRRLSTLLDFFIRHYIKMAECCHNYRALHQKNAYIDQAERLSVLLSEHASHTEDAKAYLEKLCALRRRATRSRSQDDPPETPRRNPDGPAFTTPLTSRFQSFEPLDRFVQIPEFGETKEYDLESTTASSVYNLGAPRPGPRTNGGIPRTAHREEAESLYGVELRQLDKDTPTNNESSKTFATNGRVISLVETQQESFLTETTYI